MIKTVIIPKNNTVRLSVHNDYIGKEIEVLLYTWDELLVESRLKGNISRFKGILSKEEADKDLKYLDY